MFEDMSAAVSEVRVLCMQCGEVVISSELHCSLAGGGAVCAVTVELACYSI